MWGLCIKVKVRVVSECTCFKTYSLYTETNNCVFRQYSAPIAADAGEYNMGHEKRGRVIILNHEKYKEGLGPEERTGTNADKMCLKQCFEKLKFDVDIHDDLKVHEVKNTLTEGKYEFYCSKM